jgi:hypothetical protein
LINVPSVKGYEGWRNFAEFNTGEVRKAQLLDTSVNTVLLVYLLFLRAFVPEGFRRS